MTNFEETEYGALFSAMRDGERTWRTCWTAGMLVACASLSWGIAARHPGPMAPAMLATALAFTSMLEGRRRTRLISGYLATYAERSPGGPRWFTRLGRLGSVPGFTLESDWPLVGLANAVSACAVAFAWWFSSGGHRGEMVTVGLLTGAGVAFLVHSISQTLQMERTTAATIWQKAERLSTDLPAAAA